MAHLSKRILVVLMLAAGCGEDHTGHIMIDGMIMEDGAPMDHPDAAPAGDQYAFELTGGHGHIYKDVALVFTARHLGMCTTPSDVTTCMAMAGVPLVVMVRAPGSSVVTEQRLQPGKLDDNGDGTYTYARTFGLYGAYAIGVMAEGSPSFAAFTYDTARGGGERFFCDADGDTTDDRAFQVRWNANKERLVADGATEVAFSIELVRSWNTPINTTDPWTNSFDHLMPGDLTAVPSVMLMADEDPSATHIATLTPVYKGKGIYEV